MADRRILVSLITGVPSLLLLVVSLAWSVLPDAIARAVDPVLSEICHRLPHRSLVLPWGVTGLCARCTAFWAGMSAGAALNMCGRLRIPLWGIAAMILPLAVDGSMQYLGLYESVNWVRMVTGALCGTGLAAVFTMKFDGSIVNRNRTRKRNISSGNGEKQPLR